MAINSKNNLGFSIFMMFPRQGRTKTRADGTAARSPKFGGRPQNSRRPKNVY